MTSLADAVMIMVSGSSSSTSRITRLSWVAAMSFSAIWLKLIMSPSWLQLRVVTMNLGSQSSKTSGLASSAYFVFSS